MPLKVMLLYFLYLAKEIEGIPLKVMFSLKVILFVILKLILFALLYFNPPKLINIPKAL